MNSYEKKKPDGVLLFFRNYKGGGKGFYLFFIVLFKCSCIFKTKFLRYFF